MMRNNILNEQLKIAVDYWTKVLNEHNDNDSQNDGQSKKLTGFQALQRAIIDKNDIENFINLKSFTVNLHFDYLKGYNTPMQAVDCIMENMKITEYYPGSSICICEKNNSNRNPHEELRLKLAFAPPPQDSKFIFLFKSTYDEEYCVPGVLKDCKNGILYLDYDMRIRLPQDVIDGETSYANQNNIKHNSRHVYRFNTNSLDCSLIDHAVLKDNPTHTIRCGSAYGWHNVKDIEIEDGIKYIYEDVLNYDNVENIILPNSIEYIGNSSFTHLPKLKSIVIPDSVVRIGYDVFECGDNSILQHVQMPKNLLQLNERIFQYTPIEDITIFINSTKTRFGIYDINTSQFKSITIDSGLCQKTNFIKLKGEGEYYGHIQIAGYNLNKITFANDRVLDIINMTPDYRDKLIIERCPNLKTIYVPSERFKDYVHKHCQYIIDKQNVQVIIK